MTISLFSAETTISICTYQERDERRVKPQLDCYTCFVKQMVSTVGLFWKNEDEADAVMREVLLATSAGLSNSHKDMSAIETAGLIQKIIRDMLGSDDPYKKIKWMSNDLVMKWYPDLQRRVARSTSPFEIAVRMAIAGNIIDFGLNGQLTSSEVEATLEKSMTAHIDREQVSQLQESVRSAENILYITDNAGEIVFDKLLIEQLPLDRVVVGVRGGMVLNDATREDAEQVGLTDMVRVVGSGAGIPGTVYERCSPEFQKLMRGADLIIAKGQGNFESLNESGFPVVFLFLVKCPVVAKSFNLPERTLMIWRKPGKERYGKPG